MKPSDVASVTRAAARYTGTDLTPAALAAIEAQHASNTVKTYAAAWRTWQAWCSERALFADEPRVASLCNYVTQRAETGSLSTVRVDLAALRRYLPGCRALDHAALRATVQGLERLSTRKRSPKRGLSLADLACGLPPPITPTGDPSSAPVTSSRLRDAQDRALLLLGWSIGCRRSELVALDAEDLDLKEAGFVVQIRRSKTDQHGHGRIAWAPWAHDLQICPVRAVLAWREVAGIEHGPLFLALHGARLGERAGPRVVAGAVKRLAVKLGGDPRDYGGHSLRRGFASETAAIGISEADAMRQTGHRSVTTFRRYVDEGTVTQRDHPMRRTR